MDSNEEKNKPRWLYRFDNYEKAFTRLAEAIRISDERPLTQLEKEGIVQRFEYTWELAWKTMKDYLSNEGVVLDRITPASVIRASFESGIIGDGEKWMEALDARNRMSHTYDPKEFEKTVIQIQENYLKLFEELHKYFTKNHPEK